MSTPGLLASAQVADRALTLPNVVCIGAGIHVFHDVALEHSVDQYCHFACGGGDRFGFADADSQTSIKSAQCRLRLSYSHGRRTENLGGTIGRGRGSRTEQSSAGDLVVRRER